MRRKNQRKYRSWEVRQDPWLLTHYVFKKGLRVKKGKGWMLWVVPQIHFADKSDLWLLQVEGRGWFDLPEDRKWREREIKKILRRYWLD